MFSVVVVATEPGREGGGGVKRVKGCGEDAFYNRGTRLFLSEKKK